MKRAYRFVASIILLCALSAAASAAGKIERKLLKQTDLAGKPGTIVIMTELVAHPGAILPKHRHPGDAFLYVLQGGQTQAAGGEITEMAAGASLYFPRGKVHGGFVVVGDTPIKVLTVHIVDKGKPLVLPAQ